MIEPQHITGRDDHPGNSPTSFTVNRAERSDDNVVISWTEGEASKRGDRNAAGFSPTAARRMAAALLAAADEVDRGKWAPSPKDGIVLCMNCAESWSMHTMGGHCSLIVADEKRA